MKSYLKNIFDRTNVTSIGDAVRWWNKGRLLLNVVFIICTAIHLSILILVFKNGWVFFLLPSILLLWVVVNLIFSAGLFFELFTTKFFKSDINFNKLSPSIKRIEFVMVIILILAVSIWHLLKKM